MTHIIRTYFLVLCLFALALSLGCGNSASSAADTSREIPSSGPQATRAALTGTSAANATDSASSLEEPAEEAPTERAEAPEPTPSTPTERPRPSRTARDSAEGGELGVRRLVVAEGIEEREPVGATERFEADNDRIFAFVEAVNHGEEAGELVVTFESEEGDEVGHITLNVPADAPRWRTWAWSRHVREAGLWHAVIRTADGEELARQSFEIEG